MPALWVLGTSLPFTVALHLSSLSTSESESCDRGQVSWHTGGRTVKFNMNSGRINESRFNMALGRSGSQVQKDRRIASTEKPVAMVITTGHYIDLYQMPYSRQGLTLS